MAFTEGGRSAVDTGTEYTGRLVLDPHHGLELEAASLADERVFSCQVTAGTAGSAEGTAQVRVYGEDLHGQRPHSNRSPYSDNAQSRIAPPPAPQGSPVQYSSTAWSYITAWSHTAALHSPGPCSCPAPRSCTVHIAAQSHTTPGPISPTSLPTPATPEPPEVRVNPWALSVTESSASEVRGWWGKGGRQQGGLG